MGLTVTHLYQEGNHSFEQLSNQAVIRRKRKCYKKASAHYTAENILNRNFQAEKLNEKWSTDVSDFTYGNGYKAHLSAIKDFI